MGLSKGWSMLEMVIQIWLKRQLTKENPAASYSTLFLKEVRLFYSKLNPPLTNNTAVESKAEAAEIAR